MFIKTKELKMNLQLFGNDLNSPEFQSQVEATLSGGGQEQAPVVEQPVTEVPQTEEGQTSSVEVPEENPNQMEQPLQAPQQELILGKFKTPEELANAYANLEQFNTKTRQELSQYKSEVEALAAAMEQIKQGQAQNKPVEEVNPEEEAETFMNKFYQNPKEALQQIINEAINPIQQKITAEEQQKEWVNKITSFANQTPDFEQFKPVMEEILAENPELGSHPKGLDIVYNMAKGRNYQDPQNIARNFLQDDNFVKNNIMGDKRIKEQIIQEYLQGIKNNNQAPVTINSRGGQTAITPENQPKTFEEAGEQLIRMMSGQQ